MRSPNRRRDVKYSIGSLPQVIHIGRCVFDPDWAEIEHVDQSSELIYIMRGSLTVSTMDVVLAGVEGDVIWLPAQVPHRDVVPPESDFEVYLIQFLWAEEERMKEIVGDGYVLQLSGRLKSDIANMVLSLDEESVSDSLFSQQITACKLGELLWTLCREARTREAELCAKEKESIQHARPDHLALQAKRLVKARFNSKLDLDHIAEHLGVSSCYLSRIFRRWNGVTLSSYVITVRMENAKRLLSDSRMNIEEVARASGYDDVHYFRRVFKRLFACSPSQWRARLLSEAKSV
jgi:AraC-like DNA-binding protein